MVVAYPVLAGEIARRGIKKNSIASGIGISNRALYNKLSGTVAFTWDEVRAITDCFFPDVDPKNLFTRADSGQDDV